MLSHEHLTRVIIGTAFRVHNLPGPGHLEHVYRNALAHLLRKQGYKVLVESRLFVFLEGAPMGYSEADLVVEDTVVVETRAVEEIRKGFEYRIRAYLASSPQEVGLILNFGATKVDIRREVVSQAQKKRTG